MLDSSVIKKSLYDKALDSIDSISESKVGDDVKYKGSSAIITKIKGKMATIVLDNDKEVEVKLSDLK